MTNNRNKLTNIDGNKTIIGNLSITDSRTTEILKKALDIKKGTPDPKRGVGRLNRVLE